jgi:hypothetical protein
MKIVIISSLPSKTSHSNAYNKINNQSTNLLNYTTVHTPYY